MSALLDKKIGILGLGHVGLTLGLTLAEAGFSVEGYDIKDEVRRKLTKGEAHFSEEGLNELLAKHLGKKFIVVDEFQKGSCDVYLITVGTPLKEDLTPDYSFIDSAAQTLGPLVKKGDLIILRSTVPLGTTRDHFLPKLEKLSGHARGELLVAFAPERTIEGDALRELTTLPQIVGGIDEASLALARDIFATLTSHVVELPSLEEAEIVKLINNAYRETVFSFANEVSLIARSWGLNTKRVIRAANEGYPRSNVPLPSPGVGGYCLTKDGLLLSRSGKERGEAPLIVTQTRAVSTRMIDSIAREVKAFLDRAHPGKKDAVIGILGFAFKGKPYTSDMRGSMTTGILKRFETPKSTYRVIGFDPHVTRERIEGAGVEARDSVEAILKESDVVLIMNNNTAFENLPLGILAERREPVLVYDTWGLNDEEGFAQLPDVTYHTL